MPRAPSRMTQYVCVAITVAATVPWVLLVGALLIRAVDSSQPLTMAIIAWLVMLVPMWVAMLAAIAWKKRNETERPAVIMALPPLGISALFFFMPATISVM